MADEIDIQSNINEEVDAGLGKTKCRCGCFITEAQRLNHESWSETHHNFMINRDNRRENANPDSVILDM